MQEYSLAIVIISIMIGFFTLVLCMLYFNSIHFLSHSDLRRRFRNTSTKIKSSSQRQCYRSSNQKNVPSNVFHISPSINSVIECINPKHQSIITEPKTMRTESNNTKSKNNKLNFSNITKNIISVISIIDALLELRKKAYTNNSSKCTHTTRYSCPIYDCTNFMETKSTVNMNNNINTEPNEIITKLNQTDDKPNKINTKPNQYDKPNETNDKINPVNNKPINADHKINQINNDIIDI